MDGVGEFLRWFFLLGCVLPTVILLVLGIALFYFGQKWVGDFVDPDLEKLEAKLKAFKEEDPDITDQELISKVVHQEAFKCGVVGAITGFGGFVTLPIAIPVDMVLTARYQATMVSFIAKINGYEESLENKMTTYAIMTGSTELSKLTIAALKSYAPRIIGKSLSKLIPFLGAVLGFIVNYTMAQSLARAAQAWYRDGTRDEILKRLGLDTPEGQARQRSALGMLNG
ncbi:MAG: EcsC family protein [Chloroflexota bacterium]